MSDSRRNVIAALAAATFMLGAAGPAGAAIDPERNASTPTSWHWWTGVAPDRLQELVEKHGERVVSLSVDSPHRTFTAATVRNAGVYARAGGTFFDKTEKQVIDLTAGQGRRLVDLEPYERHGAVRFAGVTVTNAGPWKKGWWWNHGLGAGGVDADVAKHGIRLVDLNVYRRAGLTRYAYVGVRNTGEDRRDWWWYPELKVSAVNKKVKQHGARIIDIERVRKGIVAVVMVRNDEHAFGRWVHGFAPERLNRYVQSRGVRITDIERVQGRLYATMMDNVDAGTGRIRRMLLDSPYGDGYFGAFAKRVGGPVYVGLAHEAPYQPMSVMKLVPHLYVMDRFDGDPGLLDRPGEITWSYHSGDVKNAWCPGYQQQRQTKVTTLRDTLQQALGVSLNTAHDALLSKYTPEAITARVQAMGLTRTTMYVGCPNPGKKDWLSSRTTLADMGRLFEGVDERAWFPQRWSQVRSEFYGLMASWGRGGFKEVLQDEAAKAGKSAIVDDFMKGVEIKGKGGGMHLSGHDGRALSYRVTIPVRVKFNGVPATVKQNHVGGFFVNDMPSVCIEDVASANWDAQTSQCKGYVTAIRDIFKRLTGELHRTAIRAALKTW